jgi:hypothetical protein
VRPRHAIVHERAGDELSVLVIDHAFEQRLADALRDPAMDLALDDHRVDHGADVVDAPEAHDLDAAGLRIDLELAHMRAVAEGEARRIVDRGFLQPRLHRLEWKIVRHIGGAGDLRERDPAVGAGDHERAIGELDVARRRFQQMTGDQLALGDDLVAGAQPPTAIEREPKVPVPCGTASVSPSLTSTLSTATPSFDARICA